ACVTRGSTTCASATCSTPWSGPRCPRSTSWATTPPSRTCEREHRERGRAVSRPHESAVRVAVVHPDLLGTYGDGGNGVVLAERLRWRGIPAEVIEIRSGDPVPATCHG